MSNITKKRNNNEIETGKPEIILKNKKKIAESPQKCLKKQKGKFPSTRSIPFSGKYV